MTKQHLRKTALLLLLPLLLQSLPASADPDATSTPPQVGDVAQNLKIIPPWTMRLCQVESKLTFHATYLQQGALQLKQLDNDCALWKEGFSNLQVQVTEFKEVTALFKKTLKSFEEAEARSERRIVDLESQLKKEIAEKNKHKYKTSYGWVGYVVGGGLALAAIGVLVGVFATPSD